jgi:hypothetical protein
MEKMELFATPESMKKLAAWIELHPPENRMAIWTAAGMAWNLACEIANNESTGEDEIPADDYLDKD